MNDDARAALATLGRRLAGAGIPFALGGSGLLWALGLAEDVADLDVQLEAGDQSRALAVVGGWLVELVELVGDDGGLWANPWLARLRVGGVDVDAIGGLAFRHAGGVAHVPLRTTGRVTVGGFGVPCADPALWWAVYRAYAPGKAALLEAVVGRADREAVRAELGLAPSW